MRGLVNSALTAYFHLRMNKIEHFMRYPHAVQEYLFFNYLEQVVDTEWGTEHGYGSIRNYSDFARQVPIQDYESLRPYIYRMIEGGADVLWPGIITLFSKSSGTTSDKSKYIPVSKENLKGCHIRGTWDTMTLLYEDNPGSQIFERKNLLMGGALAPWPSNPSTLTGDISAIMIHHMPAISRPFFTPGMEVALMSEWESKIAEMVRITSAQDVSMFGGVPTWILVYLKQILEYTGKAHVREVWPHLEAYIHGGVNFAPYREQFRQLIPATDMRYYEVYNASEGFFAAAMHQGSEDMLLLLDNGIFYEFVPLSQWDTPDRQAIPLEGVQVNTPYVILITTNSGLVRYSPGDTIVFTNINPYTIQVIGRTQQYINVFGEEVMVHNVEKALAMTCQSMPALITDYTIGPIYMSETGKGGHHWVIEFEQAPTDLNAFAALLDDHLRKVNGDYDAKRYHDMALSSLTITPVPSKTFFHWLHHKGRVGGQSKIPRLANHRQFLDEILNFVKTYHHGSRNS